MPQDGGQRLDVHSVGEGIGGKGVPHIMKAHPLTARVVQQPVQPLAHHRWEQRRVLLLGGRKQPSGNIPFPVLSEHLQHFGRQEQSAYRRLCLWLSDHHLRAYDHRLFADSQFARSQIQVSHFRAVSSPSRSPVVNSSRNNS